MEIISTVHEYLYSLKQTGVKSHSKPWWRNSQPPLYMDTPTTTYRLSSKLTRLEKALEQCSHKCKRKLKESLRMPAEGWVQRKARWHAANQAKQRGGRRLKLVLLKEWPKLMIQDRIVYRKTERTDETVGITSEVETMCEDQVTQWLGHFVPEHTFALLCERTVAHNVQWG